MQLMLAQKGMVTMQGEYILVYTIPYMLMLHRVLLSAPTSLCIAIRHTARQELRFTTSYGDL